MVDRFSMEVDVRPTLEQLRGVDRKVRKKTLRKAVTAATKVIHKEARRLAPRVNGFFRMSLRTMVRTTKDKAGEAQVIGRVGQEKNKQFKRKRYRGSNVNRRGNAARVWWIESGTKRHEIKPSGRVLAWTAGRRKGSKGRTIFSRRVNHPGMRGQQVLERSARLGAAAAARAFAQVSSDELAKVPAPGGGEQ